MAATHHHRPPVPRPPQLVRGGPRTLSSVSLGRAMKSARDESGLSLFQMSRLLDVWATTVAAWERGTSWPSIKQLDLYARHCGVSLREVLPS